MQIRGLVSVQEPQQLKEVKCDGFLGQFSEIGILSKNEWELNFILPIKGVHQAQSAHTLYKNAILLYIFKPGSLKCPVFISALHWARLWPWFVMCGGRSSILHYGPLIETNYLYAPTPNGQSPSASLNKIN